MKNLFSFLFISLSLFLGQANAQVATFFNHKFDVKLPSDYCTLPIDSNFYKFNKDMFGKSIKLGFIAAPCITVRLLTHSKISSLPHYIAFELVGIENTFVKFPFGDYAYVNLITVANPEDLNTVSARLNRKSNNYRVSFSNLAYKLMNKSNKAVTYVARATMDGFGKTTNISLIAMSKLVNDIPVAVHVYDEDTSQSKLQISYAQLLDAVNSLK